MVKRRNQRKPKVGGSVVKPIDDDNRQPLRDNLIDLNQMDKHRLWEKDSWIGLTIAPSLDYQGLTITSKKDAKKLNMLVNYHEEKNRFIKLWLSCFKAITGWVNPSFRMVFEISKGGLFHWHGYFQIKDPPVFAREMFYLRLLAKNQIDIRELKTEDQRKVWHHYCYKDIELNGMKESTLNANSLKEPVVDVVEFLAKFEKDHPSEPDEDGIYY